MNREGRGVSGSHAALLGLLLIIVIFLLNGCGVRELEDRAFPLAVSYDYEDDKYDLILAYPDLSLVTQQDKSEESGDMDTIPKLSGKDMEEINQVYYRSSEKYLDYGHVQAIILGKGLLANEDKLKEVLQYLEEKQVFARNVLLFVAEENPDQVMGINGRTISSLGEYLGKIYKNNLYLNEKDAVTLGDLLNHWHNQEENLEIPILSVVDGKPVIIGTGRFNKLTYQEEEIK